MEKPQQKVSLWQRIQLVPVLKCRLYNISFYQVVGQSFLLQCPFGWVLPQCQKIVAKQCLRDITGFNRAIFLLPISGVLFVVSGIFHKLNEVSNHADSRRYLYKIIWSSGYAVSNCAVCDIFYTYYKIYNIPTNWPGKLCFATKDI